MRKGGWPSSEMGQASSLRPAFFGNAFNSVDAVNPFNPLLPALPRWVIRRIRSGSETTIALTWIADRLHMGAPGHVACLLYRSNQDAAEREDKLF